ncbi:nucleotide-binding protein [Cohnella sp.]|uniref:nucleotide-binding protein n=1 Tax=Cohnella sp. TaxID=1883426 RepID=UPI003703CB1C
MNIFIGSSNSSESLKALRQIALIIEEEGHVPIPWNKPGLFPLGNYVLDSLRDISLKVDAAVLIFNEDDRSWYRNDSVLQPRDNVVLEYGLFVSQLGREKTIICRRGNTKVPSDLNGIIYCDLNKEFKAQSVLVEWLQFLKARKIN